MKIGDRILELRKVKGISQEELADNVGVSRQAVSKWESEQSIPDMDKIILLSEFFNVTTDYLLKGVEKNSNVDEKINEKKEGAYILNTVGTSFIFLGVIMSVLLWNANQDVGGILAGVVFIMLGLMVSVIGFYQYPEKEKTFIKIKFWKLNIWPLTFIVLSLVYNILASGIIAPYPLNYSNYRYLIVFLLIYLIICFIVVYIQVRKEKRFR